MILLWFLLEITYWFLIYNQCMQLLESNTFQDISNIIDEIQGWGVPLWIWHSPIYLEGDLKLQG